ncbi:hypothetical protein [Helicobacter felis]|uniref:hypothetical protein n=1 Tax=Helicobacter felis TaxID=214 RepID=UPI001F1E925D|nr:hypothetical protein [Helicobacter felis]
MHILNNFGRIIAEFERLKLGHSCVTMPVFEIKECKVAGKVVLRNEAGESKVCKVGFSWTTLFFGVFVPLLRKDWKWFGIFLVTVFIGIYFYATYPDGDMTGRFLGRIPMFFDLVMAFIYNKIYINGLLSKGYAPLEEADRSVLNLNGWRFFEGN